MNELPDDDNDHMSLGDSTDSDDWTVEERTADAVTKREYKRTFEPWGKPMRSLRAVNRIQDGTIKFMNIIALGASGVGKTTVLSHFAMRETKKTLSTVAVDYTKVGMFLRTKPRPRRGNVVHAVLNLIDSPGDTRFDNFTDRILATAHGCLLIFDASDRATLDELKSVAKRLRRHCPRAPRALVANKMDRYSTLDAAERWMTDENIREAMVEFGCKAFYPICAQSDLAAIDEMMVLHAEAALNYTRRLRRDTRAHDDIVQLEAPRSPRYYRQPSEHNHFQRTRSGNCEC